MEEEFEDLYERDEELRRVVAFHGHICPGLAYGVRVARAALRELGPRARDEEIVAIVENDSCAVDAIQVLTGCTFGKGNLVFRDYGKSVYTFLKRNTGQGLRISVDFDEDESPEEAEAWRRFREGDRSAEVLSAVAARKARRTRRILGAPEEELMRLAYTDMEPPPRARIHPSVRCASCGEKVMEPRARLRDGAAYCPTCFSAE